MKREKAQIDKALGDFLLQENFKPPLHEMLSYPLLSPGKRLRPILVLWGCESLGGKREEALKPACGVECLHVFSLVHDDLPGMDNSDIRWGKPTAHKVFGEGKAVLIGDALLLLGIKWISEGLKNSGVVDSLSILCELAQMVGPAGLVGGQFDDISGGARTLDDWLNIYERKTSRLFQFSLLLGGTIGGGGEKELNILKEFGKYLGIAFQLGDDLLDLSKEEPSIPREFGVEVAKKLEKGYIEKAVSAMSDFSGAREKLISFAEYIGQRNE
ncbi:MAG: polyprenyl synthetase family protein [Caldiserica bacterium]|nr:polyprenyl synthetase family protein [Caldisericota bacterium]MDH7562934.1 polyprenyl synthetase family protein [Caldisericota bacterium]